MIWHLLGTLMFGAHASPSFYARLARRQPAMVGEPVRDLMARLRMNLERDYLVRMVALRMVLLTALLVWAGDLFVTRPVSAEDAAADAREQLQARDREVQQLRDQVRRQHFGRTP